MIIYYNDIKLDIPDYKNMGMVSTLVGVRDKGKILELSICLVNEDNSLEEIDVFYGSGGYWRYLCSDYGNETIQVTGKDNLGMLTYFYSKICEGIHNTGKDS